MEILQNWNLSLIRLMRLFDHIPLLLVLLQLLVLLRDLEKPPY